MYNERNKFSNTRRGRSSQDSLFDVLNMKNPTQNGRILGDYAPSVPEEDIGGRCCDGSMPGRDGTCPGRNAENGRQREGNAHERNHGWGLVEHPLAMVYSPYQIWRDLYTPEVALTRGTIFPELDLPLEITQRGGC